MEIATAEQARSRLDYDPATGEFHWSASVRVCGGKRAGKTDLRGYRHIKLMGRSYLAHRLAWLYVMGEWPVDQIDHINGDRADNRFCNLRLATHAQNMQNRAIGKNNTSGFMGVKFRRNKWRAEIRAFGNIRWLGSFNSPEEAHAAYLDAKQSMHRFSAAQIDPRRLRRAA